MIPNCWLVLCASIEVLQLLEKQLDCCIRSSFIIKYHILSLLFLVYLYYMQYV
jgi:hypothetical protein